jgi:hypothetical protein
VTATKLLRLVVAINPTASFGKGRDVGPAVVQTLRALGHDRGRPRERQESCCAEGTDPTAVESRHCGQGHELVLLLRRPDDNVIEGL